MHAIILLGPMGAGKSTIAKTLSQKLQCEKIDIDDEIVSTSNLSIPQIFEQYGESYFRTLEYQVLENLLLAPKDSTKVIASGGGIITLDKSIDLIFKHSFSIYLQLEVEEQFNRVKNDKNRPMLYVDNIKERLKELYALRHPRYLQASHYVQDASLSVEEIVDKCIMAYKNFLAHNGKHN